jgi:PAS domain S-box-containing protein
MTSNDRRTALNAPAASSGTALRRRAEESLRDKPTQSQEELGALAPEETLRRLHELRVLQIELEMQNDELRRAQVELDAARVRYFDLYDMAPAGYCTTSQKGVILQVNFAAATLLGLARGALVNQPISRFIFKADQDLYYQLNKQLTEGGGRQRCELRMVKNDGTPVRVHLVANLAHEADDAPHLRIVMVDVPEPKRV